MDVRVGLFLVMLYSSLGTPVLRLGASTRFWNFYHDFKDSVLEVPINSFKYWAFDKFTVDVFNNSTLHVVKDAASASVNSSTDHINSLYIQFCDNLDELLDVYFSNIKLENLNITWKGLSHVWIPGTIAKSFGIQERHILGQEYGYVVLRVDKQSHWWSLDPTLGIPQMTDEVAKMANNIIPGNSTTVKSFIYHYGTHYLNRYATGDSLYQVFVYGREEYLATKSKLPVRGRGEIYACNEEIMKHCSILSPSSAEYVGRILSYSGSESLEQWVKKKLQASTTDSPYLSMLKLGKYNMHRFKKLEKLLGDEEVTNLEFKSILSTFQNAEKSAYFTEYLVNSMK